MDLSQLFALCNAAVVPFWLMLVLAPRWSWTQRIVHSGVAPAALGSVYLALLATSPEAPEGASFASLDGVMLFFSVPHGALAGWVHYLVFDLFVGAWEARDAQRHDIPQLALAPCLLLTFMLGPIGLLLYLGIRAALRRTGSLIEA